jgi:hypothetical protein
VKFECEGENKGITGGKEDPPTERGMKTPQRNRKRESADEVSYVSALRA